MEDGNLVDMEVDVEWPPHPLTSLVNQGVELSVIGMIFFFLEKALHIIIL